MALSIKGERDWAPGSFVFAGIDHLSPSSSEVAQRCCPEQQGWSWLLWAPGKAEVFPGALAFRKQRNLILQHSGCKQDFTLNAASSFCSLPSDLNSWALLPFVLSSSQLQGGWFGVELECGRMNVCCMNGILCCCQCLCTRRAPRDNWFILMTLKIPSSHQSVWVFVFF